VYAICGGVDDRILVELRGVDDETPHQVRAGDLAAVVGSVDLDRFGADGLRRSLNDLDQLAAIARAHHAVVEVAAAARPTAPARLATVYDDEDRVREMLEVHRDAFVDTLDHVAGRQEWGVKAYGVAQSAGAPESPESPEPTPTTGAAYLRQRRAALSARDASRRQVSAGAEAIHERLASLAVDARRHRPQDPQLSGDTRSMVLNNAYLVDVDNAETFARAVTGLLDAHPELAVELTGPWPPYSFAVIEEEVTP
jgi:Gas vesicle synthesis protein GvpL/GvpF